MPAGTRTVCTLRPSAEKTSSVVGWLVRGRVDVQFAGSWVGECDKAGRGHLLVSGVGKAGRSMAFDVATGAYQIEELSTWRYSNTGPGGTEPLNNFPGLSLVGAPAEEAIIATGKTCTVGDAGIFIDAVAVARCIFGNPDPTRPPVGGEVSISIGSTDHSSQLAIKVYPFPTVVVVGAG